jgi:hypothetical protein
MHNLDNEAFQRWLQNHFEASERTAIPLFANNDMIVQVTGNRVPIRNQQMEQFYSSLICSAKDSTEVCGIIYCMYWIRAEQIVPLYFGKAEKYGNNGGVSDNLTKPSFFGRWGYPKYYHMGDLGIGLRGGRKNRKWVERLFDSSTDLRLRSETFFGAMVWTHNNQCPCGERTNVAALEECLIRHARRFWPDDNLNQKDGGPACRCPS